MLQRFWRWLFPKLPPREPWERQYHPWDEGW